MVWQKKSNGLMVKFELCYWNLHWWQLRYQLHCIRFEIEGLGGFRCLDCKDYLETDLDSEHLQTVDWWIFAGAAKKTCVEVELFALLPVLHEFGGKARALTSDVAYFFCRSWGIGSLPASSLCFAEGPTLMTSKARWVCITCANRYRSEACA